MNDINISTCHVMFILRKLILVVAVLQLNELLSLT